MRGPGQNVRNGVSVYRKVPIWQEMEKMVTQRKNRGERAIVGKHLTEWIREGRVINGKCSKTKVAGVIEKSFFLKSMVWTKYWEK